MKEFIEKRGRFNIKYYEILINEDMKKRALNFAKNIVLSDNQYNRLLPKGVKEKNDKSIIEQLRIQRTYTGKLGELVFLEYLKNKKITNYKIDDMFNIYQGQSNTDSYDFKTKDGKTIDVKTGFRDCHKRLVVNKEQFEGIPKDFYVAVKLNAIDIDKKNKLINLDSIKSAYVLGYAEHEYLKNQEYENLGEGESKAVFYNKLMGIDYLLCNF